MWSSTVETRPPARRGHDVARHGSDGRVDLKGSLCCLRPAGRFDYERPTLLSSCRPRAAGVDSAELDKCSLLRSASTIAPTWRVRPARPCRRPIRSGLGAYPIPTRWSCPSGKEHPRPRPIRFPTRAAIAAAKVWWSLESTPESEQDLARNHRLRALWGTDNIRLREPPQSSWSSRCAGPIPPAGQQLSSLA